MIKNEIPILEFDTEQTAVISPVHENLNLKLPKKCVFAFLGDYIEEYADKSDTRQVSSFISATKRYPIYVTQYKGEEIVLCQAPVGAAAAVQILDWLIGYGVCEIISAGSCGALEYFDEGTFLVPSKALRDEGTSYHYAPPSRFMEINERAKKLGLAQTHLGRLMMADASGEKERDNWTSADDTVHLLRVICETAKTGSPLGRWMISLLARQQQEGGLRRNLPDFVQVAHKCGNLAGVEHDAGIFFGKRPYLLAVLTTEQPASYVGRETIGMVSLLCARAFGLLG